LGIFHYLISVTKTDIENWLVPIDSEASKMAIPAIKIEPATLPDVGKFDENKVPILPYLVVRNCMKRKIRKETKLQGY
jgi:hypothetical protein